MTKSIEMELESFLENIDGIPDTISEIISYQLKTTPSGIQILAFKCSPDYTARFLNADFGLVSTKNLQVVDFIPRKLNQSFCINKAALELFENLTPEIKDLKGQLVDKPLVVTARSLGGYVAILFTLWLQHYIDMETTSLKYTKRPICITFGCPLVGDQVLQRAISQWKPYLLNVVAKTDPVACFFSSNSRYKPLGTSLFCTESGDHTSFEDQESVLPILDAMASLRAGNMETPDYGKHLKSIKKKLLLYHGFSRLGEFRLNTSKEIITWHFREVGVVDDVLDDEIRRNEEIEARKKINAYLSTKKLTEMKLSLTYMEWYLDSSRSKGGYYDCHRKEITSEKIKELTENMTLHQCRLNQYWMTIIKEKDRVPQKEGVKLHNRWLYDGSSYRRIVEPLNIAEYYKKGKQDYLANRPNHYKMLEDWSNEYNKNGNPSRRNKKKAASVTEDSCFWAHVEEALISLTLLKNGGSSFNNADALNQKLDQFETNVMSEIENFSVSPDIFLEGSSFMKWWNEYKEHKGISHDSEFAQFMNSESYKLYE